MTRRTPRLALAALSCVALAAIGVGCSPSSSSISSSKMSEPRPEIAPEPELSMPTPEDLQDELGSIDDELGDLGDLSEDLGLGEVGDCLQLTAGYAQLVVLAFQGEDGKAQADQIVADLREVLPPDLMDEVDVVAEKVTEASQGDWLDTAGALSDPEFRQASEAIGQWLQTECGG